MEIYYGQQRIGQVMGRTNQGEKIRKNGQSYWS